jgi:hypothetical protein
VNEPSSNVGGKWWTRLPGAGLARRSREQARKMGSAIAGGAGSEDATCPWPLPAQGIDIVLLMTVIIMVGFGLLMVYSSSFIYAQEKTGDGFAFIKKQVMHAALGFGVLMGVCRLDYRRWAGWA